MGTSYTIEIAVGYEIEWEQFLRIFGKPVDEQFHMEDRFDPKTGKKLDSVKVIDHPARTVLGIGGRTIDTSDEDTDHVEDLEKALGVVIGSPVTVRVVNQDLEEDSLLLISVPQADQLKDPKRVIDYGRTEGHGGFYLDQLIAARDPLYTLGLKLADLGFKVERPIVRVIGSYG